MEEKKSKGIGKDLLKALIIAVGILALVTAITLLVQGQYKEYFLMDQGTLITSDIIGFVLVFFIAFGFLRSGRKKEKNKYNN